METERIEMENIQETETKTRTHENTSIITTALLVFVNTVPHLFLFTIFIIFFGVPAVERYQERKVIVIFFSSSPPPSPPPAQPPSDHSSPLQGDGGELQEGEWRDGSPGHHGVCLEHPHRHRLEQG